VIEYAYADDAQYVAQLIRDSPIGGAGFGDARWVVMRQYDRARIVLQAGADDFAWIYVCAIDCALPQVT